MFGFFLFVLAAVTRPGRKALMWTLILLIALGLVMVGAFSASASEPATEQQWWTTQGVVLGQVVPDSISSVGSESYRTLSDGSVLRGTVNDHKVLPGGLYHVSADDKTLSKLTWNDTFVATQIESFVDTTPVPSTAQTTTAEAAQADPIWVELGLGAVGAQIPARWQDHDYWDVPHTYNTPGSIEPEWAQTGDQNSLPVRFKHIDAGLEISSIQTNFDLANPDAAPTVKAFIAGNSQQSDRVLAEFGVDPFGHLAGKIGDSAGEFMTWNALNANGATKPDLTQSWWQDDYKRSWGIGTALWACLVLINIARTTGWIGRKIEGEEWARSTAIWTFAYFVGSMSGPLVGDLFIQGSGELTDNIIATWSGSSASDTLAIIGKAIRSMSTGAALGGIVVALLLLPFILVGALMVFVSLSLQTALIYMSGAIVTITFAWIVSHKGRQDAAKVPMLIGVLIFSKPALFLLLGVGFGLIRSTGDQATPGGILSVIIMGIFILIISALAPTLMLRYIPMPGGDGHTVLPSLNPRKMFRGR